MLKLRSPSQQEQILSLAMRQIEKMLKEMQTSGKDLSLLKLKKFQKTHHIDCKCKLCENAKQKMIRVSADSSRTVSRFM
jgi:hypothetical protein